MGDDHAAGAILCAGFGTRMRPLTEALPKPILPFLNAPFLTYPLERLASADVERVGFNLHHLPDTIPPVADRLCRRFGLEPSYAREWEIMGTAGGVRGIWRALDEPDAPLVVSNGDSLSDIDLGAELQAHRASGAAVTMVVRPKDADQPGRVWVDDDERLLGLRDFRHPEAGGAELSEYDFTGIHIIESDVLEEIPLEPGCIVGDVYGPMLEDGLEIRASVFEGFWAALDNPDLLMDTTRRVLDAPDLFDQAPLGADSETRPGVYWLGRGEVPEGVTVEPPVFVGHHVEVDGEADLGPYAVVDGTELTDGAAVRNAVVYGVDRVGDRLTDCIAVADRSVGVDEA